MALTRFRPKAEIEVALPVFVQAAMAGGDRYLAASWSVIRAGRPETSRMAREEYEILGQVQKDASRRTPSCTTTTTLPRRSCPGRANWTDVKAILRRAARARSFDYQPPFDYAFKLVDFKGDVLAASEWLQQAAGAVGGFEERLILQQLLLRAGWIGARISTRPPVSSRRLAPRPKRKDFTDYLRKRAQRLRDLALLRRAATVYVERQGKPAGSLNDLLKAGLVEKLPVDPFGFGYAIDAKGLPIFSSAAGQ